MLFMLSRHEPSEGLFTIIMDCISNSTTPTRHHAPTHTTKPHWFCQQGLGVVRKKFPRRGEKIIEGWPTIICQSLISKRARPDGEVHWLERWLSWPSGSLYCDGCRPCRWPSAGSWGHVDRSWGQCKRINILNPSRTPSSSRRWRERGLIGEVREARVWGFRGAHGAGAPASALGLRRGGRNKEKR